MKERFERCLDLYLCPRAFKRRLNIDPESLVPRLPRPRELKPFPNALCVEYKGHAASVRCIACSGDGQWMATGDDNGVLILWEVGLHYMCEACVRFSGGDVMWQLGWPQRLLLGWEVDRQRFRTCHDLLAEVSFGVF